jgi:hypothetical protein
MFYDFLKPNLILLLIIRLSFLTEHFDLSPSPVTGSFDSAISLSYPITTYFNCPLSNLLLFIGAVLVWHVVKIVNMIVSALMLQKEAVVINEFMKKNKIVHL